MKNYCETHHLFYSSVNCPCCISDKAAAYEKKYAKIEKESNTTNEQIDLSSSLKALQEKFNSNKK
jgi:uncharacterized protein (DUF2225 family)